MRVLDLPLIRKGVDGAVEASELREVDDSEVGHLRALEGDLAVLLAEEDVDHSRQAVGPAWSRADRLCCLGVQPVRVRSRR